FNIANIVFYMKILLVCVICFFMSFISAQYKSILFLPFYLSNRYNAIMEKLINFFF
ncbi:hypothetical protein HUSEC41_26232, partial [Escherichia coli O104:H4 str. 01-09591]